MISTLEDISTIVRRHLLETYCDVERWPIPSQVGFAVSVNLPSGHGIKRVALVKIGPQHIEVRNRYDNWGGYVTSYIEYHREDILADLDRILLGAR